MQNTDVCTMLKTASLLHINYSLVDDYALQ